MSAASGDDTRCFELVGLGFVACSLRFCDQRKLALRDLGLLLHWRMPHTHVQSRTASWDSRGCEKISWSGLCFCESSGFRGDGVDACIVSPGGFGGAAAVLKLSV